MGSSSSALECEYHEQIHSNQIDRNMRNSRKKDQRISNVLLVGVEQSGTSRILRQIEILHHFNTNTDNLKYNILIKKYIINSMLKLYNKCNSLYKYNPIKYYQFKLQNIDKTMIQLLLNISSNKLFTHLWSDNRIYLMKLRTFIANLWLNKSILLAWELIFSGDINMKYYFDQINSIMTVNYNPNINDIIHLPYNNNNKQAELQNNLLIFNKFHLNLIKMNKITSINDKWFLSSVSSNICGIIFVASLNCNKFEKSIKLFNKIINNKYVLNLPVVLILDKYCNDNIMNNMSINAIKNSFLNVLNNNIQKKKIYIHQISYYNNNNLKQINQILQDIQHIRTMQNLNMGGLV